MVQLIEDIQVIENAIIAFREGASDEKRMATQALERLLYEKMAEYQAYEEYIEMEGVPCA